MDHWMKSRYGSENTLIQLPICPRCKTPIRHNLRYSSYIKPQLALIEKIKLKYFGDIDVTQIKQNILKTEYLLKRVFVFFKRYLTE